jgi:hypothetical protein
MGEWERLLCWFETPYLICENAFFVGADVREQEQALPLPGMEAEDFLLDLKIKFEFFLSSEALKF